MLEFNIRNQSINRIDRFSPAEKSVNYLIAKFNFLTDEWNGADKTAVFQNKNGKNIIDMLLDNDMCVVPWEVVDKNGKVTVSVYGTVDGRRITTDTAEFKINPTIYGGSATQEPTPDIYQQILERINELEVGGGGGSTTVTGYLPTVEGTTLVFNEIVDGNEVSY